MFGIVLKSKYYSTNLFSRLSTIDILVRTIAEEFRKKKRKMEKKILMDVINLILTEVIESNKFVYSGWNKEGLIVKVLAKEKLNIQLLFY